MTHSGRRSRRESRQSRLRASTVLHLMAAKSVMNQLACDVNLSEQAELWRLEGGISRSDERFLCLDSRLDLRPLCVTAVFPEKDI